MGCTTTDEQPQFLSHEEDKYTIVVVLGTDIEDINTQEIVTTVGNNLYEMRTYLSTSHQDLSNLDLEVKESPIFMIYDTEGKVLETNNDQEVLDFFNSN